MAVLPEPQFLLDTYSDKVRHMAAFFTLAVLGFASYPQISRLNFMLALIAFGGLIEVVQLFPALHRESELSDWGADIIAVFGALICIQIVRSMRAMRRSN